MVIHSLDHTRWIAGASPVAAARLGADAGNIELPLVNFEIPGSGYLLLCTDGLWNYTPTISELDTLIRFNEDANTVAKRLVEFALRSGGRDNISVAILLL